MLRRAVSAARFLPFAALDASVRAELALSIDVVFHLVEDAVFASYMHALFAHATRFVLIYSSNTDRNWSSPHVRHRRFTDYVADCRPEWRLLAHVPSRYPFDPAAAGRDVVLGFLCVWAP